MFANKHRFRTSRARSGLSPLPSSLHPPPTPQSSTETAPRRGPEEQKDFLANNLSPICIIFFCGFGIRKMSISRFQGLPMRRRSLRIVSGTPIDPRAPRLCPECPYGRY
ncbi:hypothetical protein EVAR_78766_1 [Eumeta japonica]|uniref:Uncharacterized protein n=1 Tax=Eumeta variegata TaxID=151549 RepID=A0A4C1T3Z1_EUMVA|nr:hypothetical protein EVAR_78766_1 [Eumeta japonica]